MVRNQVQLIAYADRLGGDLRQTRAVIDDAFGDAIAGVHLLPFFTPFDGADAGFDPVDHTRVDPRLGDWADVSAFGPDRQVVVDVIVNHVSADSVAFRDVRERGDESPYFGMFLTMSTVFPDGATEEQLAGIYRPRPGLPFTPVKLGGRTRLVWTTFSPQQIDIDVFSDQGGRYLDGVLAALAAAGVAMVRLDAVGYAVKTPGGSCFMTPETFEFIEEFTGRARRLGMEVLVEVHSYFQRQIEIGHRVDRVYDFALPPLVLHALTTGDAVPLRRWLDVRPANAVTVLDTHDGIGVIDVGPDQSEPGRPGLLTDDQLHDLVEGIHERTGGQSRAATGWAASNLDIYQVNSTYYDALGADDARYLAARALQFFTPGIPQVYYVGALAGGNDMELLGRTGVGRDINRHRYTPEEVAVEVRRPVVAALIELMRLRNQHPAFDGEFSAFLADDASTLTMAWSAGDDLARLEVNCADASVRLTWTLADGGTAVTDDLLDAPALRRR